MCIYINSSFQVIWKDKKQHQSEKEAYLKKKTI